MQWANGEQVLCKSNDLVKINVNKPHGFHVDSLQQCRSVWDATPCQFAGSMGHAWSVSSQCVVPDEQKVLVAQAPVIQEASTVKRLGFVAILSPWPSTVINQVLHQQVFTLQIYGPTGYYGNGPRLLRVFWNGAHPLVFVNTLEADIWTAAATSNQAVHPTGFFGWLLLRTLQCAACSWGIFVFVRKTLVSAMFTT